MAEAVFLHKVREAGLSDQISADSAGTGDWHVGSQPHHGTRNMLAQYGIDYEHQARTLRPSDFEAFDLILTMDEENYKAAVARQKLVKHGKAQVRRFLEFAPASGLTEVPDPYYHGRFDETYDLVSEAADGLIDYLRPSLG